MSSFTWNGTGDWADSADWSPSGGPPGTIETAEIVSGTVDVSGADLEDASALTVDSGAAATIEGTLTIGDGHLNGVPNILSILGTGSVVVSGGLTIGFNVTSASGLVTLSGTGTFEWESPGTSTGLTIDMGANAGSTTFLFTQPFDGAIDNFNGNDHVTFSSTDTVNSITPGTNSVTLNTASGAHYTINFGSGVDISDISLSGNALVTSQAVCFVSGVRIRTTGGEVAVEDLTVGDLAVTAWGEARPITWIGHRRIEQPTPEQMPVRVAAGAFGEDLPTRDLFLSPGHAVCVSVVDELFVPIGELVNDATIVRADVSEVTYWHVELESHDLLMAEGMPCESYMDAGNRAWFGRDYGRLAEIDPERVAESLTRYARPFVSEGPVIQAVRERLAARAEVLASKVRPTNDKAA